MKRFTFWLITVFCTVYSNRLLSQGAQISEKQVPLITYPFSDPDPVPAPGKMYPYFRFEGYAAKGVMRDWKMVEMENDFIKLWITPEIGGKIWGAVEKSTGKEFVYYNNAVKFRDVAMRGPWTSGGIEINFGIIGHAPTSSSPVDYLIRNNDDGSVSCFVGAIDLSSRTRWSVEINLPKDKAYYTTRSVWDNPTGLEQAYYHWMNMGIKTAGNLEYIFPGNYHLGHDGKPSPWPVDEKGRQISYYDKNNFGSYKSYHVFGEPTGFYGAYWHNDDFGFVHYSSYDAKPGKKVWIWGLSDEGMIWEKLLTDSDGQYTEIQSGRLFNQAAKESSLTPFKNRGFAAGSTDEWTEFWFPVKQTKGLKAAVPAGSVNLQHDGSTVKLWFCPNEKTDGKLEVRNSEAVIFSKGINAAPMQVVADAFNYDGTDKNLSIWLNNQMLFETHREKNLIKRPVLSPADFNWETAYGLSLKGKELERQRLYKGAEVEYLKALEVEPWFVPALNGMANLSYRKTDYNASLEYAGKALSVDTYDADANMIFGLSGLALGDTTTAIDGFSIATSAVSHRSAAYNALASVFAQKKDYAKALDYAQKSLEFNQLGSEAIQLKILCLRKLGMQEMAAHEQTELEVRDPLNHFIRFERFLADASPENKTRVQQHITNELPQETYLEYALWYYRNGQLTEAMKILELAPQDHPVVLLWESYLNHLTGKEQIGKDMLAKSIQINPQFVLPFRLETLEPLIWVKTLSDDWKISYYTGLIYLNAGAEEKGMSLWKSIGDKPDFYPFYIARSQLWESGSHQAQADVEKALTLSGDNWRAGLFASKYYLEQGNLLKAEVLARDFYAKNPQNYYLGLHQAKMLVMSKNYASGIKLLQKLEVLPNEGATDGRIIWRNANIGNALDLMQEKKYRKALESIGRARQWPENLGVGKPYNVDERLEDFIALQIYQQLKDNRSAQQMKEKITREWSQNLSFTINDFLTAWVLKETGNKSEGDRIMVSLTDKNPASKMIQWSNAIYAGESERAKSISSEIDRDDQTFLFLKRIFSLVY